MYTEFVSIRENLPIIKKKMQLLIPSNYKEIPLQVSLIFPYHLSKATNQLITFFLKEIFYQNIPR